MRVPLEEADLALAEDEDPPGVQVLLVSSEGETGLLDVWAGDRADESRSPAQHLEPEPERLCTSAEQHGDCDRRRIGHSRRCQRSGSMSPKSPFLRR